MLTALDLFCGAGGVSRGLAEAGFDVTGVDIKPQPHYPFKFVKLDVIVLALCTKGFWDNYNLIWASPPCQKYSVMTKRWGKENNHPDLIGPVRKMLIESGKPYCIENVVGAPLINSVMLCGSMFGLQTKYGSQLRRHRLIECNFEVKQPKCNHNKGSVIGVYGGGQYPGRRYHRDGNGNLITPHKVIPATIGVYGNSGGASNRDNLMGFSTADRRDAMGIQWMTGKELSQAIPPAYSKYIAEQFLLTYQRKTNHAYC